MAKNQLTYTMQAARWRAVLERRPPVMTPYEKRLSAALDLAGLEGDRLVPAILEVFSRFRLFSGRTRPPSALRLRLTGRLAGMMTRLMPTEIVHTDVVDLDRAAGAGEGGAADPRRAVLRLKEDAAADRQYIESCFGHSLLPARELGLAEQALGAGIHLGCRLWYTAGVPPPGPGGGGGPVSLKKGPRFWGERLKRGELLIFVARRRAPLPRRPCGPRRTPRRLTPQR